MPKRSKSSARWLAEHAADPYVKRAHEEGWRSRAAFKLEEIQKSDRLLKPGMTVDFEIQMMGNEYHITHIAPAQ